MGKYEVAIIKVGHVPVKVKCGVYSFPVEKQVIYGNTSQSISSEMLGKHKEYNYAFKKARKAWLHYRDVEEGYYDGKN